MNESSQRKIETLSAFCLTILIWVSICTIFIGFFVFSLNPVDAPTTISLKLVFQEIFNLNPVSIMFLGILILLIAPISIVLISLFIYIRQRNRFFYILSFLVLLFFGFSLYIIAI